MYNGVCGSRVDVLPLLGDDGVSFSIDGGDLASLWDRFRVTYFVFEHLYFYDLVEFLEP